MPHLRSNAYLTCFYCGRRTSTRKNGSIRRFECPSCEATNYLDENGDITDPPVEVTGPTQGDNDSHHVAGIAATQSTSDVFCDKCLLNQRLFTASLAQYLPGDPDDPEYEERERDFYRFRKNLEKQYPQTCAECEPKVQARISQAGYTAKTDHLRRLIDRSMRAKATKKSETGGALGALSVAGWYLWVTGFVLQGLWHMSMLQGLAAQAGLPAERSSWLWPVLRMLSLLAASLPRPESLMKWSILSTAGSLWWNPFFVKTVRGFTKHLLGIGTWYTYQAMIVFFRTMVSGIPNFMAEESTAVSAQAAAHTLAVAGMLLIAKLALDSIRVDTTPLFGTQSALAPREPDSPVQHVKRRQPPDSFLDTLDEVLQAPIPARDSDDESETRVRRPLFTPRNAAASLKAQRASPAGLFAPATTQGSSFGQPQTVQVSATSQNAQYDVEMDWQPTSSQHRAFNSFGSPDKPLHGFNDKPVNENPRPFWYKVPPAPARNEPKGLSTRIGTTQLRKQPELTEVRPLFIPRDADAARREQAARDKEQREQEERARQFKKPTFRYREADPLDPLSDMFEEAFTISPGRATQQAAGDKATDQKSAPSRQIRPSDFTLLFLCGLLLVPGYDSVVPEDYRAHLALSMCCVSLTIWARVVLDTRKKLRAAGSGIVAQAVAAVLGAAELGSLAWAVSTTIGDDGGALMAFSRRAKTSFVWVLVLHQLWNIAVTLVVVNHYKPESDGAQVQR